MPLSEFVKFCIRAKIIKNIKAGKKNETKYKKVY